MPLNYQMLCTGYKGTLCSFCNLYLIHLFQNKTSEKILKKISFKYNKNLLRVHNSSQEGFICS